MERRATSYSGWDSILIGAIVRSISLVALVWAPIAAAQTPETVSFLSADGTTLLTGFVFSPKGPGRFPAVVMLHGRTGPFGSAAAREARFDAGALSMRHQLWGRFWAERGYVAIHVDSFTPRGYGKGFPKGSINSRPPEVSANLARPKDAYGALRYLMTRADVDERRVGVHGWSNGAMTVLSVIGPEAPGADVVSRGVVFRAAIAQYPGCGIESNNPAYAISVPLLLTVAGNDDEVSPSRCQQLAARMMNQAAPVRFLWLEGAGHGYDSPDVRTQSVDANRQALERTMAEAEVFFSLHLKE